jgi:hypothetical protein
MSNPPCGPTARTSEQTLRVRSRKHRFLTVITKKSGKSVNIARRTDRFFRAITVTKIAVPFPFWSTTSGTVHSAHAPAANRRRKTRLPRSFRFGFAARRVVGALHGVDGHLDLVPPPTPTGSGSLTSFRVGIGVAELAPRREGDATLRLPPVATLSAMIA